MRGSAARRAFVVTVDVEWSICEGAGSVDGSRVFFVGWCGNDVVCLQLAPTSAERPHGDGRWRAACWLSIQAATIVAGGRVRMIPPVAPRRRPTGRNAEPARCPGQRLRGRRGVAQTLSLIRGEPGDVDQTHDVVDPCRGVGDDGAPYEWPTASTGPGVCSNTLAVYAESTEMPRSGFAGAVTCTPLACSRSITPFQLEPSANAPCTSTTVGELDGVGSDMDAPGTWWEWLRHRPLTGGYASGRRSR